MVAGVIVMAGATGAGGNMEGGAIVADGLAMAPENSITAGIAD
jgi:hypothetical protein